MVGSTLIATIFASRRPVDQRVLVRIERVDHELEHLASALDHVLSFGREPHLAGRPKERSGASSCSSCATAWLTAEGLSSGVRAAPAKLPASATPTKISIFRS